MGRVRSINSAPTSQVANIEIREGFVKGITAMEVFVEKEYQKRLDLIESLESKIQKLSEKLVEAKASLGEVEEVISGASTMKRQVTQLQFSFMEDLPSVV